MQINDLTSKVGQVVTLDLVSGAQFTTKVLRVEGDAIVCKKPIMFHLTVELKNPNLPPSPTNQPEGKVQSIPYGAPLYETPEEVKIDAAHIIMLHKCPAEMVDGYSKMTSSLVSAPANALHNLDALTKRRR